MWPNQWLVCIIGIKPELLLSFSPNCLTIFFILEFRMLHYITQFFFSEVKFFLTGSRPLFGTSHCWSKSLNPILCVSKWWSASKKLLVAFFWPKTGFFLPVRATWSSKSWQNTQSKCKNWGPSREFFCKITV